MNREQAKQLLPIIQAFAGGAEVQSQGCITGDWYIINDPDFNPATKWRIKPKPRERWTVVDEVGSIRGALSGYLEAEDARKFVKSLELLRASDGPFRIVHMREVDE